MSHTPRLSNSGGVLLRDSPSITYNHTLIGLTTRLPTRFFEIHRVCTLRFSNCGLLFLLFFSVAPAWAESAPIHIQADGQIVCNQGKNSCIAEGNAVATREDLVVRGDVLKVFFAPADAARPETKQKRSPVRLEAVGHVVITTGGRKASGERADYDILQGLFTLRGAPRIEGENDSLFSQEPLQYSEKTGIGVAQNGVFVQKEKKYVLRARTVRVFFVKAATAEKKEIEKVEAEGEVLLSTPDQTLRADTGLYEVPQGRIILKGHVEATQGGNLLEGAYAVINIKDGDLQLYAEDPDQQGSAPFSKGRVKALLVPKELQKGLGSAKKQA